MNEINPGYLRQDLIIPENWDEARNVLMEYLRANAYSLNDKDIGHYVLVSELNGQKWFSRTGATNANTLRFAFRKVLNFGALPNAAATAVAHGITTNANTTFTRIYGCATDPGATSITSAIPIPFADPAVLANAIRIEVDATNVTITTAANYSAYSTCYVVLEWLQN